MLRRHRAAERPLGGLEGPRSDRDRGEHPRNAPRHARPRLRRPALQRHAAYLPPRLGPKRGRAHARCFAVLAGDRAEARAGAALDWRRSDLRPGTPAWRHIEPRPAHRSLAPSGLPAPERIAAASHRRQPGQPRHPRGARDQRPRAARRHAQRTAERRCTGRERVEAQPHHQYDSGDGLVLDAGRHGRSPEPASARFRRPAGRAGDGNGLPPHLPSG